MGGAAPHPHVRLVPLDWDGLERALLRPCVAESYLDTHSGEVIELVDGWSEDRGLTEQELADHVASGRFLRIEPLPEPTVHGWMVAFVSSLEDSWARDGLREALAGPAPMRAFEEALGRFPRERQAWVAWRDAREAAVLRAWLEAKDVVATTEQNPPGQLGSVADGHDGQVG